MKTKTQVSKNYWAVILLQYFIAILLSSRILELIDFNATIFYVRTLSVINITFIVSGIVLYLSYKTSKVQKYYLHFVIFLLTAIQFKFILFNEPLTRWLIIKIIGIFTFVLIIQSYFVLRYRFAGFLFSVFNAIIILWLFVDIQTYALLNTHFSLKYIYEFFRLKKLVLETAKIFGEDGFLLFINLAFFLLIPFFALITKPKFYKIKSKHSHLILLVLTIIIYTLNYQTFSFSAQQLPIYKYLSFKLRVDPIVLPEHPKLLNNKIFREAIEKKYHFDKAQAYSEPKFTKLKSFKNYNLVLIHLESLRYDVFKQYMPKLYAISKEGILLENHISVDSMTMGSTYSIMHNAYPIDIAFSPKPDFKSNFENFMESNGYDTYKIRPGRMGKSYEISFFGKHDIIVKSKHFYEDAPRIFSRTLNILKEKKEKLYMYDYVSNPHIFYYYPPAFEKYKPAMSISADIFKLDSTKENRLKVKNRYLNSAIYTDYCIGNFFKAVKANNIEKNTIFVIFGDHGESLGENGCFAHGTGPNICQYHVPLIIYGGDVKPAVYKNPTSHVDIQPTLAQIFNFSMNQQHGFSIMQKHEYPRITFDESATGRVIVRRKTTMSIFRLDAQSNLKWQATLNNDYSMTPAILSLYTAKGLPILAKIIKADASFAVDAIKTRKSRKEQQPQPRKK